MKMKITLLGWCILFSTPMFSQLPKGLLTKIKPVTQQHPINKKTAMKTFQLQLAQSNQRRFQKKRSAPIKNKHSPDVISPHLKSKIVPHQKGWLRKPKH